MFAEGALMKQLLNVMHNKARDILCNELRLHTIHEQTKPEVPMLQVVLRWQSPRHMLLNLILATLNRALPAPK